MPTQPTSWPRLKSLNPSPAAGQQARRVAWFESEHENLVAALRWLWETRQDPRLQRLACAAYPHWLRLGLLTEGRLWLDRAVAAGNSGSDDLYSDTLDGAGALAAMQCDFDRARDLLEQCVALARSCGNARRLAEGLGNLATSPSGKTASTKPSVSLPATSR